MIQTTKPSRKEYTDVQRADCAECGAPYSVYLDVEGDAIAAVLESDEFEDCTCNVDAIAEKAAETFYQELPSHIRERIKYYTSAF